MKHMVKNISNKNETQQILRKFGFTFKKSLGQNFLIDSNLLNKIVHAAEIDHTIGVIEIGPGIGALTQKLAERAGKVVAIEIDQRLIPILEETLTDYQNITFIHGDVLKLDLKQIISKEFKNYSSIKVVANLPYYVTSPIIIKLLEEKLEINSITVMIQKEVAERISAKPSTKEYNSLTLLMEYYAESKVLFNIPKTVFIPKPNVDSSLLQLKIRDIPPVKVDDESLLFKIIKASFAQRRKTLFNNLLHNLINKKNKKELEEILQDVNIEAERRAETLSLHEFAILTNQIKKNSEKLMKS